MTRIDFYLLPDAEPGQRYLTACRLTEKAYRLGHRLYIRAASTGEETLLDDLLWTFRQNSFIPHARWHGGGGVDPETPVLLGHESPPEFLNEVLINLAEPIPDAFDRFSRLVEIINEDEAVRAAGRRRFRFYRDRGLAPLAHHLAAAEDYPG